MTPSWLARELLLVHPPHGPGYLGQRARSGGRVVHTQRVHGDHRTDPSSWATVHCLGTSVDTPPDVSLAWVLAAALASDPGPHDWPDPTSGQQLVDRHARCLAEALDGADRWERVEIELDGTIIPAFRVDHGQTDVVVVTQPDWAAAVVRRPAGSDRVRLMSSEELLE